MFRVNVVMKNVHQLGCTLIVFSRIICAISFHVDTLLFAEARCIRGLLVFGGYENKFLYQFQAFVTNTVDSNEESGIDVETLWLITTVLQVRKK